MGHQVGNAGDRHTATTTTTMTITMAMTMTMAMTTTVVGSGLAGPGIGIAGTAQLTVHTLSNPTSTILLPTCIPHNNTSPILNLRW